MTDKERLDFLDSLRGFNVITYLNQRVEGKDVRDVIDQLHARMKEGSLISARIAQLQGR